MDRAAPTASRRASNPTLSLGLPGPAPIGVPNFIINKFRIPPFLLPLYQAAGVQYGIRWEVLAAINEIETDYGRNLNVSSAGAVGWMQFIPSSWRTYGVDANRDGEKDPYNPVDAIFAAGRYLKAAGGESNLRRAIFAYNHADWYVDSVLMRARMIAGMPADVVGSLTGLTQGHFPVHAKSRYADDLQEREVRRLGRTVRRAHNAAKLVESRDHRRSINVYSRRGAAVIAVNDGVVKKVGRNARLGRYVVMQDVYGNRYTYAHLGEVSERYPVPRRSQSKVARDEFRPARDISLPKPTAPASAGRQVSDQSSAKASSRATSNRAAEKERLFANPARRNNRALASQNGQADSVSGSDYEVFRVYFSRVFRLGAGDVELKPMKRGARVVAGTILGRIGKLSEGPGSKLAPHLNFSIRPAGRGAPRIDPKPVLDGWKLLEATAVYRAAGRNPFLGPTSDRPMIGQILLMSKEALARRVLANPRIDLYECGRSDIRSGSGGPPGPRHARVPRGLRPAPDRHVTQVRSRLLHRRRKRLPPLVRERGRHREGQRHPDSRAPGRRIDHGVHDQEAAPASGCRPARPDHLAHGHGRANVCDGRPCRSHPRRLQAPLRGERETRPPGTPPAVRQPVGPPVQPDRRHPQPRCARQAVEVLD